MKHNKQLIIFSLLFCVGLFFTNSPIVRADTLDNSSQNSTITSNNDANQSDTTNSSQTSSDQSEQVNTDTSGQNTTEKNTQNDQSNQNTQENNPNHQQVAQNKDGWTVRNGKSYYLSNNKLTKGLKKISNNWYLFDKNGVMLKGIHKIPNKNIYGYFDNSGKRRFQNTKTNRAYYWIDKSGSITGIKNYAKVISQLPEMPTGCEITAVTMMINFAGKNITKDQAAKLMPRSHNPNKGFIGSPYKKFPLGFWVAPSGVKPVVRHYLGTAVNLTNCSLSTIKHKLINSHLVVTWVGWFDNIFNHAITLTGYHGNTIYYNDPWTGTKRSMSVVTFMSHWALDAHRALSY
ncbi:C39 family peptidase [Lactobacillus pasteurii]|uniref:Peptidase C39-like domain-containing protein n=1 Tax=Lactobacillus pasteurii DSM 23907 = CRBIP 24.76 TaxID=1423790 RepID=I7JXR3_9LACO|nr:C39 family peptidase [Lactobacillus pasteurii]TDG77345.1 hypothetical protein C5L33_000788 [Lactobacillus pasteurii]CCI84890.1 Putative uncharacterized protein [Lactobacillus pasteurii DSM 23907 = CRBIP 24.76]